MLYEFIWLEITHTVTDVGTIKCVLVDTVLSKMLKIDSGDGQPSYWQCADCDYRSYKKDSYNLKNHIEAKHIVSDGHYCSECGRNVPTKDALRKHMATNHPKYWEIQNIPLYNHFICDLYILVDIVMSKMLKINSGEDGQPSYWQCTDCDYKSHKSQNIKNHIESKHIISEGYNCAECGKNVPTRNALRVHVARNHPFGVWR